MLNSSKIVVKYFVNRFSPFSQVLFSTDGRLAITACNFVKMLANFDNSGTIRLGYKIVTVNNKDPKTSEIGRYNFVKYTTHF